MLAGFSHNCHLEAVIVECKSQIYCFSVYFNDQAIRLNTGMRAGSILDILDVFCVIISEAQWKFSQRLIKYMYF